MKDNLNFERRTFKDWILHSFCNRCGKASKDKWRSQAWRNPNDDSPEENKQQGNRV